MEYHVTLPSKPRAVSEEGLTGLYEVDGLFPGYGHTIGNSLRRIILSSLTGTAITAIKIDGVQHEFSTIEGVKEDVIAIMLNLKRVHISLSGDDAQRATISVQGPARVTAADIKAPSQISILNPDQFICEVSAKTKVDIELTVEKGLGYISREQLQKEKSDIGTIALDATFTPIRRVNYEVENMRVGDRTDFNRLRIFIETDGTITPREALERSIEIMIYQLKAIVGFKEDEHVMPALSQSIEDSVEATPKVSPPPSKETDTEVLKTRIESLDITSRTINVLSTANIRTVGGLARKSEEDILTIEGVGVKGLQEIKDALAKFGVSLKA